MVCIFGTNGAIGKVLLSRLLGSGFEVLGVYNFNKPCLENEKLTLVSQDDMSVLKESLPAVSHLIDCSGGALFNSDLETAYQLNYTPFTSFLNRYGPLITTQATIWLLSSAAVYGNTIGPIDESASLCPVSPYGKVKLQLESFVTEWSLKNGVRNTHILRIFSVFSPQIKKQIVYDTFSKLLASRRQMAEFRGSGRNIRSFISVEQLSDIILGLMMSNNVTDHRVINISSSANLYQISDLVHSIASYLKIPSEQFFFNDVIDSKDPLSQIPALSLLNSFGLNVKDRLIPEYFDDYYNECQK